REAGNPSLSVWVSANAGSGKTHVLTQRVLRLLLSGVAPEAVLCLTYTKAAAAEMRDRVASRLGEWALMADAELAATLTRLTGAVPTETERERARTLFARALETPGGLRILTIHAFCEAVLHRFPVEAGVPFDFTVLEDHERAEMILKAREAVLAGGLSGSAEEQAVLALFARLSDSQIAGAIDTALAEARKLKPILMRRTEALDNLRRLLGDPPSPEAVEAEMIEGRMVGAEDVPAMLSACRPGGGNRFEDKLACLDADSPDIGDWLGAFLTAERGVPKRGFPTKALISARPDLADRVLAEAERLADLCDTRKGALILARSEALVSVLGAILDRYERQKRARSLLDFDDLVERLGALFADPEQGDWVKYKLDAAITHILVDESQDTNAEQWRVVRQIADEFFSGEGAVERPRTLFAVGDEKQSIYSFQGADPRLFGEAGRHYRARAQTGSFARIGLRTSFRTLPGVLAAVDTVFAEGEPRAGVLALEEPVIHESARAEGGGSVTLWPPVMPDALSDKPESWPLEPGEASESPQRGLAQRIAQTIADWIATGRTLGPRGRAVTADDVLILVQSRGPLFAEIIRALNMARLPTPGADRLAVTRHIAVQDLLALGDVLLNPTDDLQLAALLRSPLFDVSDDGLMALLAGRPQGQTAWSVLSEAEDLEAKAAHEQLSAWRGRLDFDRPYTFFAEVLYAEGGLRRLRARLGNEIDDVMAQFLELALDHERSTQPSLQGFLAALRDRDVTIKRELNERGGGVRVMTVHGAKGLEAPIVILADASQQPQGRTLSKPLILREGADGPLLVHAGSEADHVPETLALRDADRAAQRAEYWRKLYVGMTRAEDELYITGFLTPGRERNKQLDGSWYSTVEAALAPHGRRGVEGAPDALVFPADAADPGVVAAGDGPVAGPRIMPLVPPPPRQARSAETLSPARLGAALKAGSHHPDPLRTLAEAAADPLEADLARRQGIALHALLQHLGRVQEADRPRVAAKAAQALLPEAPQLHAPLAQKALRILAAPDLSRVFGPGSRAEVPFLVKGLRDGQPIRLAGRIDRLVVDETRVLVVDYKSDARVPAESSGAPRAYVTQLGLYALVAGQLFPRHAVETAILWTSLESLMYLPEAREAALRERITLR
ncbi:MAG: double-strand break repair helicase AddA, partial [Devosia sp.]